MFYLYLDKVVPRDLFGIKQFMKMVSKLNILYRYKKDANIEASLSAYDIIPSRLRDDLETVHKSAFLFVGQ